MSGERRFPVMGGPSVPWRLVAPHERQAIENHGQSLERLAERGGLSVVELWLVMSGQELRGWRIVDRGVAFKWLLDLISHDAVAHERERAEHLATCQALANIGTGVLIAHLAEIAEDLNMQSDCQHPYAWRIVSTYSPYYADEAKP